LLDYQVEGWEATCYEKLAKRLELKKPLVVFDVETTGQFAGRDRIIQIGWVKIFPNGISRAGQIDVNPETSIPAEATRVHGITNEQLAGKLTFKEFDDIIKATFNGCDVSGFNVKFDVGFLEAECKRAGFELDLGRQVDAFKIYVTNEPRDLTAAVKFYLEEDLANAHHALADTRATARVLATQLNKYSDLPNSVEGIHDLFNKAPEGYVDAQRRLTLRDGKPLLNFGKWAGTELSKVPKDYRKWILKSDFSEAVKNVIRQSLEGEPKS
jgi:DNA polymerase-3 subunit epsilon